MDPARSHPDRAAATGMELRMALAIETQALSLVADRPRRFDSILFSQARHFAFAHDSGHLRTDLVRLGSNGLRISRVVSTGHDIDLSENDLATFLAPRRGRLDIDHGRKTWRAEPGQTLAFRPSARRTRASASDGNRFEGHVVMLPEHRLTVLRAAGQGGDERPGPDAGRLDSAAARRLAAYLAFLFDGVVGQDASRIGAAALERIVALLEDLVADAAAGWGARPTDAAAALNRVRMAEEIMRARSAEPLAMHEVAQALGVGLRSLQLAFRAVRGEEPRATLARIRLDAARARLLAAGEGDSVTTIALDCGFTHLSRFATAYRRTFGERPGETLGRRR